MVYKYIDIVGTSATGVDDAIKNAIEEAAKTIKNLQWAELGRTTVRIEGQKTLEYQTEVRIGFKVERNKNEDWWMYWKSIVQGMENNFNKIGNLEKNIMIDYWS